MIMPCLSATAVVVADLWWAAPVGRSGVSRQEPAGPTAAEIDEALVRVDTSQTFKPGPLSEMM
jgi:hypothetical protein